jgi:hypothetical protein
LYSVRLFRSSVVVVKKLALSRAWAFDMRDSYSQT